MKDRRVEVTIVRQWFAGTSRRAMLKVHKTNRIIMRQGHRSAYRDMQRHGEQPWQLRATFITHRRKPRRTA